MDAQKLIPQFNRKRNRWVIDVPASLNGGKRLRKFFASQEEANREHAKMVFGLSHQGVLPSQVAKGDRLVDFVGLFLAKKSVEVEPVTLRQLKWALNMLVERAGLGSPDSMDAAAARHWVDHLPLETRGRFNVFAVCRDFFNWPTVRERVPVNPFSDAPPKKDKGARLEILTPAQMQKLMAAEWPAWFRAWLVAGGFAGMRTREIFAVDYSAIDWDYEEITIRTEDSKQGWAARPRNITIQPAFKRHMPTGKGLLVEGWSKKKWEPMAKEACRLIGVEEGVWPSNCLRHSFASYHLAHFRDAARTAFEMGHTSPALLYQTYANCVTRREAEKWWAV
jgi:integrase